MRANQSVTFANSAIAQMEDHSITVLEDADGDFETEVPPPPLPPVDGEEMNCNGVLPGAASCSPRRQSTAAVSVDRVSTPSNVPHPEADLARIEALKKLADEIAAVKASDALEIVYALEKAVLERVIASARRRLAVYQSRVVKRLDGVE